MILVSGLTAMEILKILGVDQAMKFIETAARECCEFKKDLKVYYGGKTDEHSHLKIYFCKQCGQLWVWDDKNPENGDELVRIKV